MNISFLIGSIMGYPFYFLKEMIDTWPKERGGKSTYGGSYWAAARFYRQNMGDYNTNYMEGYWRFFRRNIGIFYIVILFFNLFKVNVDGR